MSHRQAMATIRHSMDEALSCANVPSPVITPEPPWVVRVVPATTTRAYCINWALAPELLTEPRARIAPEQFTRLLQMLWLALDDEYLGFAEGPSKRGTFAMMCHALIHCRTLEKALERGLLFYSLFPQGPRWQLTKEGDMARLSLDDSQLWDPDHFLSECLLVIWHRLGSWLIGQRIRLHQATFSYPMPSPCGRIRPVVPLLPGVQCTEQQPGVSQPLPEPAAVAGRTHPQALLAALPSRFIVSTG